MVETGRTPYLSTRRLEEIGFAIAIYPATAFLAATRAVTTAMQRLHRDGRIEDLTDLASLQEYHQVLGFSTYTDLESKLGQRARETVDAS